MNKKLIFAILTASLLLTGCGRKVVPNNIPKENKQSSVVTSAANNATVKSSGETAPSATSDAIDYNRYVKKTWIQENSTNGTSFCIHKIANGKIIGRFDSSEPAVPNHYNLENLTGTVNNDTAECQFSDTFGNKGNIKLVFKSNNEMEATIKLTSKSQHNNKCPHEGTFKYKTYNIKDIKGFSSIKDQSFMVNLNSWGNVKFVSGKLTGGNHIPTVFYLTNKDGDILYDFISDEDLPYSVDVKAVSFKDVNKDGLKDIIVIAVDNYNNSGACIANVYFQKSDGFFTNDLKLNEEINNSGKNKDIKTVTEYLSKKF